MKAEIRMTKDEWPEVYFGEIFEISSSKRVLEAQWKTSGVPFYRAREIVKLAKEGSVQNELFISEELYQEYQAKYGVPKPGDLMISAVGTLGACYVVQPSDRFYYKDASVLRFSPKQPICSRFIQHAFGTNHILDQVHAGSGSTVGTYTISRANDTRIHLPPLAEQRRIAEVLDRAEALRAKRRAALAELDSLTQSLFLDLFGDPATNPKGWPCKPVGSLALKFSDGPFGSNLKSVHYTETGVRVIRLQNIGVGEFVDDDAAYISEHHFEKLKKHDCRPGDVLVGTMGDPNLRACIQPEWLAVALNKADCVQLRPDERIANAVFVCALLNQPATEHMAHDLMQGQTRVRISMGRLRGLEVPVPPIALQQEFARRVGAVEKLKQAQRAALAEQDALFATLQHRAFRGEL